jgi:hypothetical protein
MNVLDEGVLEAFLMAEQIALTWRNAFLVAKIFLASFAHLTQFLRPLLWLIGNLPLTAKTARYSTHQSIYNITKSNMENDYAP